MSTIQISSCADASGVVLSVRTQRIDEPVDLPEHIPAGSTTTWIHHGQGLVGIGEALRISTSGPDRFVEASAAFRRVCSAAQVDDEVLGRASGLIALGSFSYSDSSERPSVLVIPEAILGTVDGEAFVTHVSAAGLPSPADLPDWRGLFPRTPRRGSGPIEVETDHSPDEYQGLVARAVEHIRSGDAGKIVLSESSTVTSASCIEPETLLRRLAARYPSTWVYRVGDVLGASPEMLAQTEAGRVFSRVLAGSRPVADGEELAEQDRRAFRGDAKELAEHRFAVDSVTEGLAGISADVSASPEPFVLRLPGIEHLASDVSARLHDHVTSLDVAARLHPSAAVSGTPRDAANALIAQLEERDRGGYASPVGWMNAAGDGQWAIALRMAHLLDAHTVRLQAGGGIVAASDPVVEHAEALAKFRPMLSALRGA